MTVTGCIPRVCPRPLKGPSACRWLLLLLTAPLLLLVDSACLEPAGCCAAPLPQFAGSHAGAGRRAAPPSRLDDSGCTLRSKQTEWVTAGGMRSSSQHDWPEITACSSAESICTAAYTEKEARAASAEQQQKRHLAL